MVVDRETQRTWGLPDEPTVREAVASGADLVTFSGDKLLGGPQAGIAVGKKAAVEAARKHPLMRALRPDKLTLAGLAATLALYRDGRAEDVPTVRMIARTSEALHADARRLRDMIGPTSLHVDVEATTSTVGGGAMPTAELPSWAVTISGRSADALDRALRASTPPVIGTIRDNKLWFDVRTIGDEELADVAASLRALG
jgi:L-seryl-tRNA(Ser) seleniumtransferase